MLRYTVTIVDVRTDKVVHVRNVNKTNRIKHAINQSTGTPYRWQGPYAVYVRDNLKAQPRDIDIDEWAEQLSPEEKAEFFGPKSKEAESAKPMPVGVIAALAAARDSLYDDMDRAQNSGERIDIDRYIRYTSLMSVDTGWQEYAEELADVCAYMIRKTKLRSDTAKDEMDEEAAAAVRNQAELYKQGLRDLYPYIQ